MFAIINNMTATKPRQPDAQPKSLYVGAINPFALVEAILGRKVDWHHAPTADVISNILQCDYEDLFDMKHESVIYAGIRLDGKVPEKAEQVPSHEMHTLTERDMITPDFSRVTKLSDLNAMVPDIGGSKTGDLGETKVKHAYMFNGNLRLILEPADSSALANKTLSNSHVTATIGELSTPFRTHHSNSSGQWTPPNATWEDITAHLAHRDSTKFSNPVQGAIGNSWLIAALTSVAWASPQSITHCNRSTLLAAASRHEPCSMHIKFFSKGGEMDAPTTTVEVNCEVPVNNSSGLLLYCRSSGGKGFLWPSLYEKAFAKWISNNSKSDHPDLTQTSHGDPIKAMAQLTDHNPEYYFTYHRNASDLLSLIRSNCANFKTVFPMCAFTHPTSPARSSGGHNIVKFAGCNLVANMAYSVLGWTTSGTGADKMQEQYVILRHPWGVTEPEGLGTSYPGLVTKVDARFWSGADLIDHEGVFGLEMGVFREYFAGLGVAK
ncbi:hypothetical protein QBC37DRAFT_416105 [Rhypophila decipiens]|uniref:Calpain catalytic domain-containing protein n=1 Tax=Rhypophila decipiens TaxID=261697 RepID=A0AAN6YDR6_9PEZI|nr:hypothetical protein QBC37DRAFT_416105 [Rhypophila decipiens]